MGTKERKDYLFFRAFLFLEDKFRRIKNFEKKYPFMDILMRSICVVILIYKINIIFVK